MEQLYVNEDADVVVSLDDATLLRGLADLRWHLDELLTGHPPVLLVDISGLTQLSSPTLAALLWAQRACRGRGGRVLLYGANSRCRDVLTRTGLLDLFGIDDARTSGGPSCCEACRSAAHTARSDAQALGPTLKNRRWKTRED